MSNLNIFTGDHIYFPFKWEHFGVIVNVDVRYVVCNSWRYKKELGPKETYYRLVSMDPLFPGERIEMESYLIEHINRKNKHESITVRHQ